MLLNSLYHLGAFYFLQKVVIINRCLTYNKKEGFKAGIDRFFDACS